MVIANITRSVSSADLQDSTIHRKQTETPSTCSICLSKILNPKEEKPSGCGVKEHVFHKDCIDKWLDIKSCCPIDRISVAKMRNTEVNISKFLQHWPHS